MKHRYFLSGALALAFFLAACAPAVERPAAPVESTTAAQAEGISTVAAVAPTAVPPTGAVLPATAPPTAIPATDTPPPTDTPTPAPAVLIGAGDVGICGQTEEGLNDDYTAEIIDRLIAEDPQAQVFVAGDVVYEEGSAVEYKNCFEPAWGRFKDRLHPVPGNHDYKSGGGPYFDYFGAAAGEPGKGYYSYDLGDWHIVALNSNCNEVACGPNSPMIKWLEEDLTASRAKCTLAYWHHPRFTSGLAGDTGVMNPAWRVLAENGAEVVISGHDHDYERMAPLNAEGQPDPNGMRQFIVGTGGAYLRPFGEPKPFSEVRLSGTHGVIRFKLYPDRYEWQFFPQDDPAQTDMGEGACH